MKMVGLDRLELSTSPLSGVRSNHLSYRPFNQTAAEALSLPGSPVGMVSHSRRKRNEGGSFLQAAVKLTGLRPLFQVNRYGETGRAGIHDGFILRKEVIQPQVPLRLPCYDFTPVADLTVAGCLLRG